MPAQQNRPGCRAAPWLRQATKQQAGQTCQWVGVGVAVRGGGEEAAVWVKARRHHAFQELLHQAPHVDPRLLHDTASRAQRAQHVAPVIMRGTNNTAQRLLLLGAAGAGAGAGRRHRRGQALAS